MMDKETKDTLKKVAEYATEKEKGTQSKVATAALMMLIALYACTVLFGDDTPGLLYGIVPKDICNFIFILVYLPKNQMDIRKAIPRSRNNRCGNSCFKRGEIWYTRDRTIRDGLLFCY